MKCSKCGADVPEKARVCPNCECAIVRPPQAPAKNTLLYAIAALAAIAAIALIIAFLAMRGKAPTTAVSPEAIKTKPITTAPMPALPSTKPITQAPAPLPPAPGQPAPKQQVPPEVIDYLNFCKQIEAYRQALLRDQGKALALVAGGQAESIDQLFGMAMDPDSTPKADPFKPVREELSRQVTNWQRLLQTFDAKQVPPQCGPFAGPFRMTIAAETAGIAKITTILAGVSENSKQSMTDALGELQGMRKDPQLQGGIDRAVEQADANLGTLCKQYGIEKPFNVEKEQPSSSLIGL